MSLGVRKNCFFDPGNSIEGRYSLRQCIPVDLFLFDLQVKTLN
jgi:hypothetical protein